MANFINNAITDNGRLLLADVQAGAVFIATKIVIGSGNIPAGKTAATMTEVVSPVKALQINKAAKQNDGTVVYGGVYSNTDISTAFYFRELALYARAEYRDSSGTVIRAVDEVLYSYGNAGATADYMPPYSASTQVEKQIDIVSYVGNNTQVDISITSGIFVTREVLNEVLEGYASQAELATLRVDFAGLGAKIGETTDTGGTATAGTVFGKLNAILSNLLGAVSSSLTSTNNYAKRLNDLWTDARVAKVDTIDVNAATASTKATEASTLGNEVKTLVSTNNTANATGTLSQKLSKVIADIAALNTAVAAGGKVPVTKSVVMDLVGLANQTVTVLNIAGAGSIQGLYTNNFDARYCSNIQVTVDGVTTNYAPQSGSDTYAYAGMGKYSGGFINTSLSSIASLCPWNFKNGFKMTLTLKEVSSAPFRATYDVYQ